MDIFNVLTMLGGLSLFLFGMSLMGQALERRAGGKLRTLLDKMSTQSDGERLALERRILNRHSEILETIRQQDADAARQAMREHTRAAGQDLKV